MESALQCISFLDVCIKVNYDNIVGYAQTYTNWFTFKFQCKLPKKRKSGLILCLLHRAQLLCTNSSLFLNEVWVLNMFVSQGYPPWFFEKCLYKFNKKFLYFHSACRDHVYNLNIPYFGHDSRRLSINYKTLSTQT